MKRKKIYLFLGTAIMALSMSCTSSDSSSSGENGNPVEDCTSTDFLPANPEMYVHALYLRPWNVDTVVEAVAEPSIKAYLKTIADPPEWGGLHMTVTSFARTKGAPTARRTGCEVHGSDLIPELEKMAKAANDYLKSIQSQSFKVESHKWSSSPRVSDGLTIFDITGKATTLHDLLGAGNGNLVGLKTSVHKLHVSFQGDQSTEKQVEDITMHLLNGLEWELCEVQITLEHHNQPPHAGLAKVPPCQYIGASPPAP